MTEIDPNKAIDFMVKNAEAFAEAKANRVYMEEFRKTLKAQLMARDKSLPLAAQERDAYADQAYVDHLSGLKEAIAVEEKLRWQLVAAQARVEVWRSQEASARAEGRAVR